MEVSTAARRFAFTMARSASVVVLLVGLVACGEAPAVRAWTDLVAQQALADRVTGERLAVRRLSCPDLARIGVELVADRWITAPVPALRSGSTGLDGLPVDLRLEACAAEGDERPVELEIVLRPLAGPAQRLSRTIEGGRALRESIPLGGRESSAGTAWGPGRLELRARGGSVWLQEAVFGAVEPVLKGRSTDASELADSDPTEPLEQILLISVDTLRADALSAETTPNLHALAAESESFAPHYAAATWTQPSHATLLTGWPPAVHGVQQPNDGLHPGVSTLAERFRAGGFATEALVHDCVWLDPRFGFSRGFDRYDVVPWYLPKQARAAGDRLLELADERFFFFFHTFDAHSDFDRLPYETAGEFSETTAERLGEPAYGAPGGAWTSPRLAAIGAGDAALLPGEPAELRRLYRLGVASADAELGALFDRLRQAGLWDRLTVVVTSDHGEALVGPGRMLHDRPWEEVLRVPLLIKWPRGWRAEAPEPSTAASPRATASLDLAPTLLEAAGLPFDDLPGRSLDRRQARPVFAGVMEPVVIDGDFKLWFGTEAPRLYDLAADPGETRALEAPEVVRTLVQHQERWSARLTGWVAERDRRTEALAPGAEAHLTAEEVERLQALGYLQ